MTHTMITILTDLKHNHAGIFIENGAALSWAETRALIEEQLPQYAGMRMSGYNIDAPQWPAIYGGECPRHTLKA